MDYKRNNLDISTTPYLKQHSDNPVWWQEWNNEVLNHALKENKQIFLSIGYSTCHWCHVMAAEAFSDKNIADYLNENFISIKVDREERPDIDAFFMSFIQAYSGSGGWPLNVFLTPDVKPIAAFTYIPVSRKFGMPPMLELLKAVKSNPSGINYSEFLRDFSAIHDSTFDEVTSSIISNSDLEDGGFGDGHKFPQCSSLLYLTIYYSRYRDNRIKVIIEKALGSIIMRGLRDHLQGGFFRYCVDPQWQIPHFEKMLYDQAMLLWTFSWAYSVFKNETYKDMIREIILCLDETFFDDGLYISAYDADTDHHEGLTYLWDYSEISNLLNKDEFETFRKFYNISENGNFENKNHLSLKSYRKRDELEDKLLSVRNKRSQPFADRKKLTSWNSLTGIALIMASKATGNASYLQKASSLFDNIIQKHYADNTLAHCSISGRVQKREFLENYAAMLLFSLFLIEEGIDKSEMAKVLRAEIKLFETVNGYKENLTDDFIPVKAGVFDHPYPSSYSMTSYALTLYSIIFEEEFKIKDKPLNGREFLNIALFLQDGHIPVIYSKNRSRVNLESPAAVRVNSSHETLCFEGTCTKEANNKK